MNAHKELHLDENQLLVAVVDESDLPTQLRSHLFTCPLCRSNREQFEKILEKLGQMVERFTPPGKRKRALPANIPCSFRWFSWNLRSAFAVAVTVMFLSAFVWSFSFFRNTSDGVIDIAAEETWKTDSFMAEVTTLAEDAFLSVYQDISISEELPDFDEEFMQFIIPSTETDSLSYNNGEKGVTPC